jgi:Type II CAAX prenyl endopeptidase Rce1-like
VQLLVDRSRKQATLAIAATWFAFCLAAALALPQPPNPAQLGLAAVVAAFVVLTGFPAASRVRPLPTHNSPARARLAAWSLLAGAAVGAILVGALVVLARAEPALRARFANRLNEPIWRAFALGFESSILEEVVFRLFVLSTVTWVLVRLFKRRGWALAGGVTISTVLFGLAHLPAWSAATPPSTALVSAVLLLNGTGALLFAWLFWRWGLPYAILAHFAGDVVVQSLAPRLMT